MSEIISKQLKKICEYSYRTGQIQGTIKLYRLGVLTSDEAIAQIADEVYRPIHVTDVKEVNVGGPGINPYEGNEPSPTNGHYRGD